MEDNIKEELEELEKIIYNINEAMYWVEFIRSKLNEDYDDELINKAIFIEDSLELAYIALTRKYFRLKREDLTKI